MAENRRNGRKGFTSNNQPRVCPHFLRNRCTYGQNCRFLHDTSSTQRSARPNHTNAPSAPRDGKLQQWKKLIKLGDSGSNSPELTNVAVGQFFQLGLELLDGDIGAAQEAIKLLAKDSGLMFIKALTERHIAHPGNVNKLALWESEVRPLFSLITHPRVVDSAVLEQQVADLFNFLLGVQGRRMSTLFNFILQLMAELTRPTQSTLRLGILELSLNVLAKIIDCNTNNIVNPECGRLVSAFARLLHHNSNSKDNFSFLQASKYVEYMQQRLDTGKDIPDMMFNTHMPVSRENFVLKRNGPGTLSADGRRHNNDHTDIRNIQIMPTFDEIASPRAEYLPTKHPSQWHIEGIRGRLDREFRLIREDTVGQLRDVVRDMMEAARDPKQGPLQKSKAMRTYTYERPMPVHVDWHRIGGLEMVVCCKQPPAVSKLNAKKRREWWGHSKRLQAGALVCLFDINGTVLFCVVSDTTMRSKDDKEGRKLQKKVEDQGSNEEVRTLSDDEAVLFVNLRLVDPNSTDISHAMRWYKDIQSSPRRYLVEFPGVLLDSFKHTLSALQKMHEKPDIPFKKLLAPKNDSDSDVDVGLPQYARVPGFAFDLGCLTTDKSALAMNPRSPLAPETLALKTSLDPTQSAALLNTLTRELSLVQGPPGTGKSYTGEKIIKVLLNSRKRAKLGPILCVCYTNHALDQLLEHLLDDGIKSIIRMGSRSKSERLENLNLRAVAKETFLTKSEKGGLWEADQQIRQHVDEGQELLRELASCQSWTSIKAFLASEYPRQSAEIFGEDRDGWKTVIHQPEMAIQRWLQGGRHVAGTRPRRLGQLKLAPLQTLSKEERATLHRHWIESIRDPIITKLARLDLEYKDAVRHKDEIRGDIDLRCLNEADIVGVTTTGLARNLTLLRKLRCKVMLCEEAGEVLEAHILTALLPSIEHAILIGDHLQLRPQIQNYDLQSNNPRGKQFSLDVSLFERLVEPSHDTTVKIPYSVLETQRRMHPSIAELVRSTLYPSLKDSQNVEDYPQVVGMRRRLFWFNHDQPENANGNDESMSTSRSNNFEVDMTVSLVSHLSQQGKYGAGDIAVLTPYLGQLQLLRRKMESMFEICVNDRDADELEAIEGENGDASLPNLGPLRKTTLLKTVRVATVDNFQGEEAKVIVISMVRNNPQKECGFLKTSNRINVLLSRAQHGMYIIGNRSSYERVPMWNEVIRILAGNGNVGAKLELQCPRHPETAMLVSHPEHFSQMSPEGGCRLVCDKRLTCGHPCKRKCHSDTLHRAVKCLEACPRLKQGCNHACPLKCGEPCQKKCLVRLEKTDVLLPCGHRLSSPKCWEAQNPASVRCVKMVTKKVPGCGHEVYVKCHEDVTTDDYKCLSPCGSHRTCGHTCKTRCFQCNTRKDGETIQQNHGICTQRCGRNYSTCQHNCAQSCHGDAPCQPCKERCEVRCIHSRCDKPCSEPCAPCAEATCASSCVHSQCTAPCAAPCNWVPCSLRCDKLLDCGHQCPSLCGEVCPSSKFCQVCATDDIKSVCVDFIMMTEYRDIDLDEEPCVFPNCGHFLAVSSMDGQMDMAAHYTLDADGLPTQILRSSEPFSLDGQDIKSCATCRGSLRSISRYGRIVRRAMLDEATKKFISWSNDEYRSVASGLVSEQERLVAMKPPGLLDRNPGTNANLTVSGSRQRQLHILKEFVHTRYDSILRFRKSVVFYAAKVRREEQPFQRVANLVRHSNIHRGGQNEFRYDQAVIQAKGTLLSAALLLKCDILILSDFFGLLVGGKGKFPTSEVHLDFSCFMNDCDALIKNSQTALYPREETQGHIFYAQLCAFSRQCASKPSEPNQQNGQASISVSTAVPDSLDQLRDKGLGHISKARNLLEKNPSCAFLQKEIDAAEEALNGGVYRPITAEELRQVYAASTGELRGTGHWYTCRNGHPFTINNCGMAMQEATCPECGAPIGGRDHVSVEGVRHATEIEEIARGMGGVRL